MWIEEAHRPPRAVAEWDVAEPGAGSCGLRRAEPSRAELSRGDCQTQAILRGNLSKDKWESGN